MAKVKGALFSEKASGKLGGVLHFRCGKFVLVKSKPPEGEASPGQNEQRELFKDGAEVWSKTLTSEQKSAWDNFADRVPNERGYFTIIDSELISIWVKPGQKGYDECIKTFGWNGYQYFICCYLRFGPEGWIGYPNPPALP